LVSANENVGGLEIAVEEAEAVEPANGGGDIKQQTDNSR
jgi:hypothetical protein